MDQAPAPDIAGFRNAVAIALGLNALLTVLDMAAGFMAGSQALKMDALDFGADVLVYAMALGLISSGRVSRLVQNIGLAALCLWLVAQTLDHMGGRLPPALPLMSFMAVMGLIANGLSLWVLARYRDGGAAMRQVWAASRADMIGNAVVLAAALGVQVSSTAWPDRAAAMILGAWFLASTLRQVLALARAR